MKYSSLSLRLFEILATTYIVSGFGYFVSWGYVVEIMHNGSVESEHMVLRTYGAPSSPRLEEWGTLLSESKREKHYKSCNEKGNLEIANNLHFSRPRSAVSFKFCVLVEHSSV